MRNIGSVDRTARLFVGVFLLAIGLGPLVGSPWTVGLSPVWQGLALIVGLVMVATALLRFCPAYRLFGWSTCRRDG